MDVEEKIIDAVHEFPCLWEVSSNGRRYLTRFFCLECLKCYCIYLGESISRGVSKKVAVVKG